MFNIRQTRQEIIKLLKQSNREGIDQLIAWLCDTDFFISPAAVNHHSNFRGGLAAHSLSVYKILCKFNEMANTQLPDDILIVAGLLHDVCKIGIYRKKLFGYKHRDDFPVGHGDKSIMLLQQFIQLKGAELYLIRFHMGPFDASFRHYERDAQRCCPSVRLLYLADSFSAFFKEVRR